MSDSSPATPENKQTPPALDALVQQLRAEVLRQQEHASHLEARLSATARQLEAQQTLLAEALGRELDAVQQNQSPPASAVVDTSAFSPAPVSPPAAPPPPVRLPEATLELQSIAVRVHEAAARKEAQTVAVFHSDLPSVNREETGSDARNAGHEITPQLDRRELARQHRKMDARQRKARQKAAQTAAILPESSAAANERVSFPRYTPKRSYGTRLGIGIAAATCLAGCFVFGWQITHLLQPNGSPKNISNALESPPRRADASAVRVADAPALPADMKPTSKPELRVAEPESRLTAMPATKNSSASVAPALQNPPEQTVLPRLENRVGGREEKEAAAAGSPASVLPMAAPVKTPARIGHTNAPPPKSIATQVPPPDTNTPGSTAAILRPDSPDMVRPRPVEHSPRTTSVSPPPAAPRTPTVQNEEHPSSPTGTIQPSDNIENEESRPSRRVVRDNSDTERVTVRICVESHQLASALCPRTALVNTFFSRVPKRSCPLHR